MKNKKINSKYSSTSKVLKSRYSVLPITSLTPDELKDGEDNGYVYLPYQIVNSMESDEVYDNFMREYKRKHKYCPKCGAESHSSTLVGYIFNRDKMDEYKDKNYCVCQACGDNHVTHDRISIGGVRKLKIQEF